MIKINGTIYNNPDIEIKWGKFTVYHLKEKRTGISPFITFHVDNIFIGLELTFSKEMFEALKIETPTDLEKYITDITYEDGKGWMTIRDCGKFKCFLTRIAEKSYRLEFEIEAHNLDEEFNIIIDETKEFE